MRNGEDEQNTLELEKEQPPVDVARLPNIVGADEAAHALAELKKLQGYDGEREIFRDEVPVESVSEILLVPLREGLAAAITNLSIKALHINFAIIFSII